MIKKNLVCMGIVFLLIPSLFAQTKYLNLSPCEFRPLTRDQIYTASHNKLYHLGGSTRSYYAPIHLPHKAVIKNVMITFWDFQMFNHTSTYLGVRMFRKRCIDDSNGEEMFLWKSDLMPNMISYQNFTVFGYKIKYKTIWSGAYSYAIQIYFMGSDIDENLRIHGVRIAYE